jgi:magnesium transporter
MAEVRGRKSTHRSRTGFRRTFRRHRPPPGSAPGVFAVREGAHAPRIHVIDYTLEWVRETDVTNVAELGPYRDAPSVTWIDVQGLGDESLLRRLAELFSIHPLVLADIVNVPQRPKVEVYDPQAFVITQLAQLQPPVDVQFEQVSLILGPTYVLTFQERYGEVFEPVRNRIRQGTAVRRMGKDYLAYAIIDAVIDGYYPVLEELGDYLQTLEDDVVSNPSPAALRRIHEIRRELLQLRRAIWPQREAVNALMRESSFITEPVQIYLRDCYDHAVQLLDLIESYRDFNSDLTDLYLSSLNNRMNEVMKLLTIISTIFIPLSFVAGVYGMNFNTAASPWNMPELGWRFGYFFSLAIMALVAMGLLVYFWRRGWIGHNRDRGERD